MRCKIASELDWPHLLYITSSYWILTERQPCLPVSFITLTIHCALQLHAPIISSLPSSSCEHYYLNNLLPTLTGTENLFSYESYNCLRNVLQCRRTEEQQPTRCYLLFYCTSYRLNMFRALLCPSPGARDYNVM